MDPEARAVARELGDRIRARRMNLVGPNGRALSQEAFAERSGLDRAYVSRVERGVTNITVLTLVRLAKALDMDPGALVQDLRIQ